MPSKSTRKNTKTNRPHSKTPAPEPETTKAEVNSAGESNGDERVEVPWPHVFFLNEMEALELVSDYVQGDLPAGRSLLITSPRVGVSRQLAYTVASLYAETTGEAPIFIEPEYIHSRLDGKEGAKLAEEPRLVVIDGFPIAVTAYDDAERCIYFTVRLQMLLERRRAANYPTAITWVPDLAFLERLIALADEWYRLVRPLGHLLASFHRVML